MSLKNPSRVRDVMTAPPETISRDATVSEAADRIREEDVGVLVVTASPPAVVTSSDVLAAAAEGNDTATTPVTEIATGAVETVPPTLQTEGVAAMMESLGAEYLPVEDGSDYVGVVSAEDLPLAAH
jgi:CBS domain-containing protein